MNLGKKQVLYRSPEMRQAIKDGFAIKPRKPSKVMANASKKLISLRDIVVIIALVLFLQWLRRHLQIDWK